MRKPLARHDLPKTRSDHPRVMQRIMTPPGDELARKLFSVDGRIDPCQRKNGGQVEMRRVVQVRGQMVEMVEVPQLRMRAVPQLVEEQVVEELSHRYQGHLLTARVVFEPAADA